LLLQPHLLDQFLEAAAAVVLQPLLPPSVANGSSSMQNAHAALAASCPWWQHLPSMLAASPVLLLQVSCHCWVAWHAACCCSADTPTIAASAACSLVQASSTLLRWLEATGQPRLWLLLSITCRPAWQQLVAAAGPLGGGSGAPVLSSAAGALQLLCPQDWQQCLARQLVQQPSAVGLLQLLQQLPGLHWPAEAESRRQQQPAPAAAAAAAASTLSWPAEDEWCQGATLHEEQAVNGQPPAAAADARHALAAWALVVQHQCWHQFACYLLVHSSLASCTQRTQQQQQQQQLQTGSVVELSGTQAAAIAAGFIAWVQQPLDTTR
jgi:hypothetical protein